VPNLQISLASGAITGSVYALIEAGVSLYPIIQTALKQEDTTKTEVALKVASEVGKVAGTAFLKAGAVGAATTGGVLLANELSVKLVGTIAGDVFKGVAQHSTAVVSLVFLSVSSLYICYKWSQIPEGDRY
jgi:hypothetical protein